MRAVLGIGVMLALAAVAGCGPSEADLGEIVYKIPAVPETRTPYPLPQLDATKEETDAQPSTGEQQN